MAADLLKLFEAAKKERDEMAEERAHLWTELDNVLADMEPMRKVEREIRARIAELQGAMFPIDKAIGAVRKSQGGKVMTVDAPTDA